MPSTPLSVLLQAGLLAGMGLGLGYLSLYVYRQYSSPGTAWFAGLLGILAAGPLVVVGLGFTIGFGQAARWLSVLYAVMLLTPVPWIGFVAHFTGRGAVLTRARLAALSGPILAGVIVVLSPAVIPDPGPLFLLGVLVVFFYVVMLVFVGGALLIRTTYLYAHLSVAQGIAPTVALIEPWFVLTVVFQPIELALPVEMGLVTAGMGLVTVLLAVSVLSLGLLETAAAAGNIGREAVLAELDQVVIVTDDADRVVRLNEAAKTVFGVREANALGAELGDVIGRPVERLETRHTVELYTASGYRTFEVGVSTLDDQHGRAFGRVITLSDVTRREIRQGQLRVLNRVLRHNLRNRMDVIYALADTIEAPPDVGDRIRRTADDLLTTSERAREIEESVNGASIDPTEVRIAELTGSIVETVREQYPNARVDHEVPPECTVRSDPAILRAVVSNLIENAAKHNDAETPRVTVTAKPAPADDARMMELVIRDNGPGISDHERAVIEAGEETALQHGSGLGLWTARWGTRLLGGELILETDRPQGTIARVRIPMMVDSTAGEGTSPSTRSVEGRSTGGGEAGSATSGGKS